MKRTIKIYLGNEARLVGTLRYDIQGARENAAFEYDTTWLASENRFSIAPGLPLVPGAQFHRKTPNDSVFHAAIADTEPDGWGKRVILRDHVKLRQRAREERAGTDLSPLNSLDFILAVDDTSRVGALRFEDEEGIIQRPLEEGRRTAPPLIELNALISATRAVESNSETAADLAYLRGRGTSLGGLRPKCTIVDADGWLSIGKFPSIADERAVTKGEILALRLAKAAGITAAEGRIVDSGGVPVALIRRFDRNQNGERAMYISAATMLGVERTAPEEHSYTEIADAIRVHGDAVQSDIDELWRRITFSILITNIDDHLLNHGFIHVGGGKWRLSPAFDINPAPERIRELKTWISEDAGPAATIDGLMSVTRYFGIPLQKAKRILRDVEAAVATWRETGRLLGMTEIDLGQFADAFEHSERGAARRIGG
jgi:serine/threonine-protein kinase HipA